MAQGRQLAFKDGSSHKFWHIELKGNEHTVNYGRVGTNGQSKTKSFDSAEEAQKSYDKLVASKLKKGYVDKADGAAVEEEASPPKNGDVINHPELGEFIYNGYYWSQQIPLPALAALDKGKRSAKSYEVIVDDGESRPPEALLTLAVKVLGNLDALVPDAIEALWADLNGDPAHRSGMWWHDGLEEAFEGHKNPPKNVEELSKWLYGGGVRIEPFGYGYKKPVAIITFESEIDPEHGIGIMTDGEKIIGTGYSMDPSPFAPVK